VVDINGRTVATLVDATMAAGSHPLALDASVLAGGVYTIVVNANNTTVSTQVTVVK
jgi:hypothetical protein